VGACVKHKTEGWDGNPARILRSWLKEQGFTIDQALAEYFDEMERYCDELVDIPVETYWNGERTECTKVRVVVGKSGAPTWWCAELEGQERNAVKVRYNNQTFYLDDDAFPEDAFTQEHKAGAGWRKVTEGHGCPDYYHAELPVKWEVH